MRIGIIYDDISREGLDASHPQTGNPGVGGTQFCYLMLLYFYSQYYPEDELIVYRHRHTDRLCKMPREDKVIYRIAASPQDCVEKAADDGVDMLLFNFGHVMELADVLREKRIKSAVWVHNWIRGDILRVMADHPFIRRVIFLVKEHYDRYIDHNVIRKGVVIPNMFCTDGYPVREEDPAPVVTYVGAIVPGKGFASLAKAWPAVLKQTPDAELYVIGKGDLYGTDMRLGPLGIAEEKYEASFAPFVTDADGKVLPSVHFMGLMGAEKTDIYRKTRVGVVNPTGRTEVCPISALEMEAACIPVVSKNVNGLPDVVADGSTGTLIRSEGALAGAICRLLADEEKNRAFGKNARAFVEEGFAPDKVTCKWKRMFSDIYEDKAAEYIPPKSHFANNLKWVRRMNAGLKRAKIFRKLPALIDVEAGISKLLRGR